MNKPIKLTQEINDPNVLLNKFILFQYGNNSFTLHYIYKVNKEKIYSYHIIYDNKTKFIYNELFYFYINVLNNNIQYFSDMIVMF